MNFLAPRSGELLGILHRNSVTVAARGPWGYQGVTWGDAVDGPSDGEPMRAEHRIIGGTCEVCGASIINIVRFRNAKGETITTGIDCAETLASNEAKLRIARKVSEREKAKRAAAKVRRLARAAESNIVKFAAELAALDVLAQQPAGSFARNFGRDVGKSLRSGAVTTLSERQSACLCKLSAEVAA